MKKFAFILMGESYDTAAHTAEFKTGNSSTCIYTVNSFEDAKILVERLADEGYGCVELCGAFKKDRALELIEATQNKMAIGYVVNEPSQSELFKAFFS